jgi:gliding motility-associated-like protein
MLPSKNNSFFCALLLFSFSYITTALSQNKSTDLSANLYTQNERNILVDRSQWKEVEAERKIFSSTFLTPDGRIITHYSKQPVNYYNSQMQLVPIDIQPVSSEKGLSANNQPNEVSVLTNGSVEINTPDNSSIVFSKNCIVNGKEISTSEFKHDGLNASMSTGITGISKTFEFRFNGVKYNYVLNTPIASSTSDFIIEEEISIPENAILHPDANYGRQDERGWLGAIQIISSGGKELGTIRGAVCFDANKNFITAAYKFETVKGKQKIKIVVPNSWINDPSRVYPITIDPLVTGPTSTFTGAFIPSCISPASDSDSILVTIPAQVSVTGLFVSGSFYASPFSTAIMNDGAMFFRTSCGSSTSFTTTGAAGISPGTAYLTAYDLKSPLLCCKPQSCAIQTFFLSMHVSRTVGGTGCNTTYVYHDPFGGYPFSAYVEGHTIEGYGPLWNVSPNSICSNVCSLTGTVYIRYGVPPFTITHPWMSGSVTAGTASGCSAATTPKILNLTIPACPWTCDTISVLSVPPPTVTDACGNILTGLLPEVIGIKETPEVTASPNPTTICSGDAFNITLTPCIGTSTVSWSGNGTSGTGTNISQTIVNTGTTVSSTTYQASALNNTCQSDTITITVNTDPLPVAGFTASPQPVVINNPLTFTDNTTVFGGSANNWLWDFGDGTSALTQNPIHSYNTPGIYRVCLAMQTSDGCMDTICQDVKVIPAEIVLPNVITPNGDSDNEFLYFKYLEFFGKNNLKVYDRWGTVVYEKDNYNNDWNATKVTDGTYYYVLTLGDGKTLPGYVQIIHK